MRSFSAVFYFATDNLRPTFHKNQFILLYFGGWSYYRLQQKHKMPSNISDPAQAWEQPVSSSPTSMVFSPPVSSTLAGVPLLRWRSNEAASSRRHSVADCGSYSVQSREEKCDSCRLQFEWGRWRYPSGWTRECSTCASPFPESCGCGVSDVESSTLLRLKDLKRRPHRRWHRLALETCHLPQYYFYYYVYTGHDTRALRIYLTITMTGIWLAIVSHVKLSINREIGIFESPRHYNFIALYIL